MPSLAERMLAWYEIEARDLPWRRTRDPYAIWISEVMLQQTRVETVLTYYERFLQWFPTVEALAAAPLDRVLKAWEGMGYYRRAQNLHQAAARIMADHGGRLPGSVSELRRLPGIGPYTAAAIASIAFGSDEPVLDGNVVRVVSRWFCVEGDPNKAPVKRQLLQALSPLVPRGRAGAFNQAVMDLGSRICLPRSPQCDRCPVQEDCQAHRTHRQTEFPQKARRKPIPHVTVVAGAVWDHSPCRPGSKLLIAQRKLDDMLGGLWELPGGKPEAGEDLESALKRELGEELGVEIEVLEPMMAIDHAYTHFRITLHVFHCLHTAGKPTAIDVADWRWVSPQELAQYAFPAADRKILDALARGAAPRSRSRRRSRS